MGSLLCSLFICFIREYKRPLPCTELIFLDAYVGPGCGSMPSSVTSLTHTLAHGTSVIRVGVAERLPFGLLFFLGLLFMSPVGRLSFGILYFGKRFG